MRASCLLRYVMLSVLTGGMAFSARGQPAPDARLVPPTPRGDLTLLTDALVARRLTLEALQTPPGDLRVVDLEGQDVSAKLKPRAEGGALTVALTSAAPFVVKPKAIPTLTPTARKFTLPGGLITPQVPVDNSQPLRAAWFRLTLDPSPVPATWDAAANAYTMLLTFGVELTGGAAGSPTDAKAKLERPVTVKFAFEGMTATELDPLTIEAHGLEHEKTVELRFVPSTDRPRLLVRSSIADANLELQALSRLDVRPVQRKVPGLGLATVEVRIERVRPHGERVPAAAALPIALQIDGRATPEPRQPVIEAGTSATAFTLRTAGLGPVTIKASADGVAGAAVVDQTFPGGPLIAVLFGGALGGFARRFVKGARRAATSRRVVEGVIVGVIAFVAGLLGVGYLNVPAVVVATEAGAFLTATLCGFAGVTVFETLTKKTAG